MGALTFLILAGILSFLTGCPRDGGGESTANASPAPRVTPAQEIPNDSGILNDGHIALDALMVKGPAK